MAGYKFPIPIHPGETLKDILESTGMTQKELSDRTGLHVKTINEIIKGKNPITSETALKLSIVFNMSETFWNDYQKKYEETVARISLEEEIEKELDFVKKFTCFNELVKYHYVEKAKTLEEKAKGLLNFLGITSFKYLETNYSVAFRKSAKDSVSKENLIAWLRCGEVEASKLETKPFDKDKLKENLKKIRSLNLLDADEYSDKLKEILSDCGVAISYVPYLKNTYVNGATRWLNSNKVLVQLTPRQKKEDILWFTLFHELYHVMNDKKKDNYISFWDESYLDNEHKEIEARADKFASEALIPKKCWDEFFNLGNFKYLAINNFAKEIGVKSGIVAGRLAKETNQWGKFAKLRTKVDIK